RIHVESRHEDHVLLPVLDENESAFVYAADVAGAQQVLADHHLRGFVGSVPIAGHHLRPAHADLTDDVDAELIAIVVTNADFRRWDRQSDRPVEILTGQIDTRGR